MLIKLWHKLVAKTGARYLIIGGSVYLLEVAVIIIAQQAGASGTLAVAIAFWVGLVISFALQKMITFGDKRMHHHILVPQLISFSLLVLFNFGFTLLVTHYLSPPVPAVISRTLALGVTVIWNFYLYKTRIFKGSEKALF